MFSSVTLLTAMLYAQGFKTDPMKRLAFTFLLLIIGHATFAQYDKQLRRLGDKAFGNKDYVTAAAYYKQAIGGPSVLIAIPFYARTKKARSKKSADITYLYFQLGESYRLYEDYLNAQEWYYKLIDGNDITNYPLARLWYGVCERAAGDYTGAIKQLQQFISEYKGDEKYITIANREILNCRFAKEQLQYPTLITVSRLKREWNIEGGNYAMIMHDTSYYFTSSSLAGIDKRGVNQLYSLSLKTNAAPAVIKFYGDKKDVSYSTPSIDGSGKHLYFTGSYNQGGKVVHVIYLSILKNNQWDTPVKLNANVNVEGYDAMQPFITNDGKRLFYTSNKPGGQGGDDIWESDMDADGNPTSTNNLGSIINTPDDEQAPYYDTLDKKLIYSSKGFVGLGGFDFFESFDNTGQWLAPVNMGYPMNSSKDDLYYSPDNSVPGKFYISSDRESECCLNLFEGFDNSITIKGIITDCATQQPLQGVKVSLVDSLSGRVVKDVVSGRDGMYTFKISVKRPYQVKLEKDGYFKKIIAAANYNTLHKDTLLNNNNCLQPFEVNKPIVIKNILYDFNKADLRPESKIVLDELVKVLNDNPSIKIELSSHTDSIGSDAYNINLSQARAQSCVDYIIAKDVDKTRITARGYGKSRPVAPNSMPDGTDNPDGRQLNRRTEFTVLKTQ